MLDKLSNETNLQYIKRIVEGKLVDKTIDDDFVELYMLLFGKEISSTEARKSNCGKRRVNTDCIRRQRTCKQY